MVNANGQIRKMSSTSWGPGGYVTWDIHSSHPSLCSQPLWLTDHYTNHVLAEMAYSRKKKLWKLYALLAYNFQSPPRQFDDSYLRTTDTKVQVSVSKQSPSSMCLIHFCAEFWVRFKILDFLSVNHSDHCSVVRPQLRYPPSWCWAVPVQASRDSTSWAPGDTNPDTVPSSSNSLERPPAAGWGTGESKLRDREAERSRAPAREHRRGRGSSEEHLRSLPSSDKDRTRTSPLPAAGSTDRGGRRPLKPHIPSTPAHFWGSQTCSPPLLTPTEAGRWSPPGRWVKAHSSFLWRSPDGSGVCRKWSTGHQPPRAWRGDGARGQGSDGWRRRGGRRRNPQRCRSSPSPSVGTPCGEGRGRGQGEKRGFRSSWWVKVKENYKLYFVKVLKHHCQINWQNVYKRRQGHFTCVPLNHSEYILTWHDHTSWWMYSCGARSLFLRRMRRSLQHLS